jgi:hypothetical protein
MPTTDKQITFTVTSASTAALRVAASSLTTANSWTSFTISNTYNTDPAGIGGSAWPYSPRMNYANGKVIHYGGIHTTPPGGLAHVIGVYDVASNAWGASETSPGVNDYLVHGFDMACCDAAGNMYYMHTNNAVIRRRSSIGVYTSGATIPRYNTTCAMAWHPGLFGGEGGVVIGDGLYLGIYRPSNNTYTNLITSGTLLMGEYSQSATYVARDGAVWIGGGANSPAILRRVYANASHDTTSTSPSPPYVGSAADGPGQFNLLTATNTSGPIVASVSGNAWYHHNGTSWTSNGTLNSGFLSTMDSDRICARAFIPASETGSVDCILFVHLTGQSARDPATLAHLWRPF